jgi:hypothetical protein
LLNLILCIPGAFAALTSKKFDDSKLTGLRAATAHLCCAAT